MLLELRQSPLALGLRRVNRDIVAFVAAFVGEDADYDSVMRAWDHPGRPRKAAIEAVLALAPAQREALGRSVEVDIGFDQALDDGDFAFLFSTLDAETRTAGKLLLASMYESVFGGKGFALPATPVLDRRQWEAAFREANPTIRVCPACLVTALPRPIENRAAVDADHYLPRSLYPALSVHGLNLVPTCQVCNRTAKGQKDPLATDGGHCSPSSIWFPYRDAGVESLAIEFQPHSGSAEELVSLAGKSGAEEQAERFDALFQLSARWSDSLSSIHIRVTKQVLDRLDGALDDAAVGACLEKLGTLMKSELENTAGEYLAGCYCAWLASTPRSLSAFVAELKDSPGLTPTPVADRRDDVLEG